MAARTLKATDLARGIRAGDRATLARAITLIESKRADHRKAAHLLVQELLPRPARRCGSASPARPAPASPPPSTRSAPRSPAQGHKVAVLAVDPSSTRTGGSILGDKTRMAQLAGDPHAFVRPSPSSGTLGGVAAKTRETMLLCEAAGYDVVLVETVGIGQSETAVADMTDFFLVLMLPGAGDELQGLKKGIVELADMIAVNKADGDNIARAKVAAAEYRAALNILAPHSAELVAAGRHLFGAHRRRHRRAVGQGARAQGEDDGVRRTRRAPARAAGEVDVDHAGGAAHRAAAQRSGRARQAQGGGGRGRRRQTGADAGGGRDRAIARGVMAVTILVTGFGPFPGAPFNPTGPLVERLARLRRPAWPNAKIVAHIFPTSYAAVDRDLPKLIARHKPDALLMFGLAPRAKTPCASRPARAMPLSLLPDAGGVALRRQRSRPAGRRRWRMPAPARRLLAAVRAARVPATLSRDAGRYLCNYLCWRAAEAAGQARRPACRGLRPCAEGPARAGSARPRKKRHLAPADLARAGARYSGAIAVAARR